MKGLLLALGAKKSSPMGEDDDAPPPSENSEAPERSYAREAFSALKDDDEKGFIEAFISAVRACKSKEYEPEEGEDEA